MDDLAEAFELILASYGCWALWEFIFFLANHVNVGWN